MMNTLFQMGGIQTVWGIPEVVYLTFEPVEDGSEVMSDEEIGAAVSALNKVAKQYGFEFSTEEAPDEESKIISIERPAKNDKKGLLKSIQNELVDYQGVGAYDFLDTISNSINSFSSQFNLPTITFDKEKTDLTEGDYSFTISSPVNPYFGTEGTMTYSCGGLEVKKEYTSGGVVTTVTYDKSAAYADAEYTSHGKPVGKYNRASGTLDISGPWGSYSGTKLVSNGSSTYDGTFGAAPALQNMMGGIQKQFGVEQIVYLDFDGALTDYNGTEKTIENIQVENSGVTKVQAAVIAAELNNQYQGTGVVFVTEKPVLSEYSTVYIGDTDSFDRYGDFTGISETNDTGNQNKSDNAFVMMNVLSGTQNIVDTISHEVGHLLGTQEHEGDGLAAYAQVSVDSSAVSLGMDAKNVPPGMVAL